MTKTIDYWIKFDNYRDPIVCKFEHIQHMFHELDQLIQRNGPIEWMQRKYQ